MFVLPLALVLLLGLWFGQIRNLAATDPILSPVLAWSTIIYMEVTLLLNPRSGFLVIARTGEELERKSKQGRASKARRLLIISCPLAHTYQFFVGFELLDEIAVHPVLRVIHVLVNTPGPGLLHLDLKILAVPGMGGSIPSGGGGGGGGF